MYYNIAILEFTFLTKFLLDYNLFVIISLLTLHYCVEYITVK